MEKIISVAGFSVGPPEQHAYMLVGVTDSGTVVMSQGDGNWTDVGPKKPEQAVHFTCQHGSGEFPCNPACEGGCV